MMGMVKLISKTRKLPSAVVVIVSHPHIVSGQKGHRNKWENNVGGDRDIIL